MTAAVARARLDLFFSPSVDGYFPVLGVPRRIVTIHDTMPEQLGAMMIPSAAARRRRQAKVRVALAQAHLVATGSAYMRREIASVFGLPAERIGVIPYAADDCFRPCADPSSARDAVAARHALDRPYLLHVGGFGPNKNLVRLVEAFAQSEAPGLLVLAGDRRADLAYADDAALDETIARRGLGERVRFLGRVEDSELVRLYQAAEAVVVPSLKEGFGLPGLEAAACGTPVIATSASPLPEALGEAAWVIDPLDVASLRRAISEAHRDGRERELRRAAALARTESFRWSESARCAALLFARGA
jgi:glycosyltransferase involved in cell wall biosynthesis